MLSSIDVIRIVIITDICNNYLLCYALNMSIQRFVDIYGSVNAAAKAIREAGHPCTQPRLQHVAHGDRAATLKLALEIEATTKGKIQAIDIAKESLAVTARIYRIRRCKAR